MRHVLFFAVLLTFLVYVPEVAAREIDPELWSWLQAQYKKNPDKVQEILANAKKQAAKRKHKQAHKKAKVESVTPPENDEPSQPGGNPGGVGGGMVPPEKLNIANCPVCKNDVDCDDFNPCTTDTCDFRRELGYSCSHEEIKGCEPCTRCADCDDNDPCTKDICMAGACDHQPIEHCNKLQVKRRGAVHPMHGRYAKVGFNNKHQLAFAMADGETPAVGTMEQIMSACSMDSAGTGTDSDWCDLLTDTEFEVWMQQRSSSVEDMFNNGNIRTSIFEAEEAGDAKLPKPGMDFYKAADVVNYFNSKATDFVDVIDLKGIKDGSSPRVVGRFSPSSYGGIGWKSTDIATWGDFLVVVQRAPCTDNIEGGFEVEGKEGGSVESSGGADCYFTPGRVVIYDINHMGNPVSATLLKKDGIVGANPVSVTISPDGNKIVVATVGLEWVRSTVFVLDITNNRPNPAGEPCIEAVDFADFEDGGARGDEYCLGTHKMIKDKLYTCPRHFTSDVAAPPPPAGGDKSEERMTLPATLVPSNIGISPDSEYAFVTFSRNNGIAVIALGDLDKKPSVAGFICSGFKNFFMTGNEMDPSCSSSAKAKYPALGMNQPNGLAFVKSDDGSYNYLTANEGFANIGGMARIKDLDLWENTFTFAETAKSPAITPDDLQMDSAMGSLWAFKDTGKLGGKYEKVFVAGGRSISSYNVKKDTLTGKTDDRIAQTYDSGSTLEDATAEEGAAGAYNTALRYMDASCINGPAPHAIVIGELWGNTHAFVSLKNSHSVAMFNLEGDEPEFVQLIGWASLDKNNNPIGGDVGTGELAFVNGSASPTGCPMLLVTNPGEAMLAPGSGNLAAYEFSMQGAGCPKEE
eukprot:TRINITY_DN20960_c0_g1_i1.p1 TRINITY_DN20960_c0_g1~~TRINITY_DN20960_c0_g1_i1.p1  ORF type:complete len:883 (-),score=186.31 TRINITY_DN20960_c0_g1_i1:83-2662(-)